MDIKRKVSALLTHCGTPFEVTTGGKTLRGHAMIQPLRYKNKLYVELQPSEVGRIDDGCFIYLGPAEIIFGADDKLNFAEKKFIVERFENVYLFGEPIYNWAILRPRVTNEV